MKMCLFMPAVLLSIGFIIWVLRLFQHQPRRAAQVLTLVGGLFTLGSFLLPWVIFSPVSYLIKLGPEGVNEGAPKVLAWLLQLLRQPGAAGVAEVIESIGGIPGWLLIVIIPTTNLWVRLIMILVVVSSVISLVWLLLSLAISSSVTKVAGGLQTFFTFLTAILLLSQMPTLDAMGSEGNIYFRLLAVLAGGRMGYGVWLAFLGLMVLSVGGLIFAFSTVSTDPSLVAEWE